MSTPQGTPGNTSSSGGGTYSIGANPILPPGVGVAGNSPTDVWNNILNSGGGIMAATRLYNWLTGQNIQDPSQVKTGLETTISQLGASAGGVVAGLNSLSSLGNYNYKAPPNAKTIVNYNISGGYADTSATSAAATASAYNAFVDNYLHPWGLDALGPQAWSMMTAPGANMNESALIAWVRGTPEYAQTFPGLLEREFLHMPPISETTYLSESNAMQQAGRYYGLPAGFMSQQEIGNLIANNVSSTEVTDRLKNGYEVAMSAPKEVRTLLHQYYGINTGALAAYYLNPQKSVELLTKQTQGAEIGNAAIATGFGHIDKQMANQLSQQQMTSPGSMDLNTFRQGFAKIAPLKPLEQTQVGQRGEATVNDRQLISSAFPGMNQPNGTTAAGDAASIRLAQEARTAGLQGGGGYTVTAKGAVGVGRAGTSGIGQA